ncbi:putative two-component histidine kinase [Gordonia hirsuta DSM 44140 = NBRC 16056]|uniref:Putative two-component histidine kinase n=1 Tax=Gordonia hirsuta DSM 44140 = NBRC 16056 TaxID=1121927 RepID=L7L7U8_9ACTN|nr:GAF domain-containing sensor histidine kinase [Gordonia hirsuta]GAC56831.1 putative two-component histidine kinase [Gordonia hirsuta DSM 44140 = NBRC 16056]
MPEKDDLASLVGLSSVKAGHYAQYRGSETRLSRVMTALEGISSALVQTDRGPEHLVVAVLEAIREHLDADWVVFALADGQLDRAGPRHLIAARDDGILAFEGAGVAHRPTALPVEVLNRLIDILRGEATVLAAPIVEIHHLHVPIEYAGRLVGGLSAWTPEHRQVDRSDRMILEILARQAAVALVNADLFVETSSRAAELAERNAEFERTQRQLSAVQRTALLNAERARIARELHDSVGQSVLSAGLQIELCRGRVPEDVTEHLDKALVLSRAAVTQLRGAIYTLNDHGGPSESLAEDLERLCELHLPPTAKASVAVRGRYRELDSETQHALLRIAGESLFNAAAHAQPAQVMVTMTYRDSRVVLAVDDDGVGDPAGLRARLRTVTSGDRTGRGRGLKNMSFRAEELGGVLRIRRSRLGGVRIVAELPIDEGERP